MESTFILSSLISITFQQRANYQYVLERLMKKYFKILIEDPYYNSEICSKHSMHRSFRCLINYSFSNLF